MKKVLFILTLCAVSVSLKGQSLYMVYMDSVGTVHINPSKMPQVAISGYYSNLINSPSLFAAPTPHNNVSRPINGTTFTISTTKNAWVVYTVNISCTATIGSTALGKVSLQYSTDSGSTWIDVSDVSNSNTVTLAVVLQSVNAQDMQVCGYIPANALCRINNTVTGTATNTFIRAQENY